MPRGEGLSEANQIPNQSINRIEFPHIYIDSTGTDIGRGVFAGHGFEIGEIVEVVPVVLVNESFQDLPTSIQRLVFNWSQLSDSDIPFALAAGFGSLYNHSDQPNLRYKADSQSNTLCFVAEREIQPGEQLTINYNQVALGDKPRERSWFNIHQVEKLMIQGEIQ